MQPALSLSHPLPPRTLSISSPPKLLVCSNDRRFASFKSNAQSVNYSSTISVFPAEACETIGGETCLADICPEVKLTTEANKPNNVVRSETVEREYMDYTDPRTVLLGEACDVLGGEFCEQTYQTGIH
ncbi:aspartokinase 1 chloroplastic [Phtheirospermum japonicum]|uniref:Aspartokinase 1 chloroplastic n=1 Tax=Phtheirospermum japonicum TaxID=374723 RepID=A0A830CU02_9LAMI|nr:aspartokinase 1 chloroplastic [Phtheirospermum japonicum]